MVFRVLKVFRNIASTHRRKRDDSMEEGVRRKAKLVDGLRDARRTI